MTRLIPVPTANRNDLSMTTIKVIAFDLDDTLWDLKPVIIRAEQRLQSWLLGAVPQLDYNSERTREIRQSLLQEEASLSGRVTELRRRVIERVLIESGVARATASVLANDAMEEFLIARNEIDLFEGAYDALSHLSLKYTLGALTNGNADVRRLGLDHLFSFVFSAEQVGAPKPDPALFHSAIRWAGVTPSEMVYVGDDPVLDIDAAKRTGLKTIWVRTDRKPEPGETIPDETIGHVRDLPAAIARLGETHSDA